MNTYGKIAVTLAGLLIVLCIFCYFAGSSDDAPPALDAQQKILLYNACKRADMNDLREYGEPHTTTKCAAIYNEIDLARAAAKSEGTQAAQDNPLDISTAAGHKNLISCEKMPDQWHLTQPCLILEGQECLRLRSQGITKTRNIDCR